VILQIGAAGMFNGNIHRIPVSPSSFVFQDEAQDLADGVNHAHCFLCWISEKPS
jgi:hypothetical protein